jgi:GAF domain-containing protein
MPGAKGRSFGLILLLLVATAAGFFIPASETLWFLPLLKGALFVLLAAVAIYGLFRSGLPWESGPPREGTREEPHAQPPVREPLPGKGWEGFGKAFGSFYRKYLRIVRVSMAASSIAIYFRKEGALKLEYGEDSSGPIEPHLVSSDSGLLAQVMANKTPFLQNHLATGFSLSGKPGTEIRSFLGAPLCARDEVVGVLAVGSGAPDDFSEADTNLASHVAELITEVMFAFRQGLQEEIDVKVCRVHLEFNRQLKVLDTEEAVLSFFAQCLARLFSFDRFTFCLRQGEEGVIRFVQGQLDGLTPGVKFPMDEGMNGWVIKRNTPLIIHDIGEGDYLRPRYFKGENSKHGLRSFIGLPMAAGDAVWGCFSLESKRPGQYNDKIKEVLFHFGVQLELALERMRVVQQLPVVKKAETQYPKARFEME